MNNLYCTLVLVFCTFFLFSQTQWIGPDGGDWSAVANWSNGLPANGNDALITSTGKPAINTPLIIDYGVTSFSGDIAVNADVFNTGNVVNSGGNVFLADGVQFVNSGSVTFTNDGPFSNDGTFINYGTFNQNGNGTFDNNTSGLFINYGNITNIGNFTNNGTVENHGSLTNASAFINNSLSKNYGSFINTFVSTLQNNADGHFRNEGGAQLFIDNVFNNTGLVTDNGTTNVNASGNINNTGTMNLNGQYVMNIAFINNGTVNNTGSFKINFGTFDNNATIDNAGFFQNIGTFNNNTGATLTNNDVVMNASCAKLYQFSNNPISNITNDGVLYNLGGAVTLTGSSQGIVLQNQTAEPAPFLDCRNIQIQTDENGEAIITAGDVLNVADAKYCNIVTINLDKSDFTCTDLGQNTVTVTMTDGFGNSSTCSPAVTVVERSPNPCNTSFLNYCNSNSTNTGSEFIHSVSLNDLSNISGNNSGYSDFTSEIAVLEFGNFYDLELVPGFPGNAQDLAWKVWVDWNNDGDFDDTAEEVVNEVSQTTVNGIINIPGVALPGTTRMRVSAKRNTESTACQIFTNGEVEDYTIKIVSDITIQNCVGDIVVSAFAGATEANVGWIPPKGFSTCQNSIDIEQIAGLANGSAFPLGETVNTFRFYDGCENEKTCSFTVTVNPTPVNFSLSCPGDVILSASPGLGGAIANWVAPFPSATCPDGVNLPTQVVGPSLGAFLPTGSQTTICYETSDNCGNSDNCCFDVFVIDPAESISIGNCPASISIDAAPGAAGAIVTYPNLTASSSCSSNGLAVVLQNGLPSGSFFQLGNTVVTYRASDNCNSADICSFNVQVNAVPAEITVNCPDDVVIDVAPGAFNQVVNLPSVTAVSTCSGNIDILQTSGLPSGSTYPLGNTVIQYQINDQCGGTDNCTFNVTLNASASTLTLNCPSDITVDAAPGEVGATVTWNIPELTTDCFSGGANLTLVSSLTSGSIFPLGTQEVIYFASDNCANTAGCSFFVNVNPTSANLTLNCPSNITLSKNTNGNNPIATWTAPSGSTTCNGNVTVSQIEGPNNGSSFAPGSTPITYQATDGCGNVEFCTFNVIVNINSPGNDPEINLTCLNDITVTATAGQNTAAVGFDVPTAATNCNSGGGNFDCNSAPVPGNNTVDGCSFVSDVKPGFKFLGEYNGSKYYCSDQNHTWNDAQTLARQNGGNLVTINDAGENEFLRAGIIAGTAWIGFNDAATEGTFQWVSGSGSYTNWLSGEPNDQDPNLGSGNSDYAALIKSDGLWRDRDGSHTYEFIMEIPCASSAPNFTLLGESNGSKYYISSTYESWEAANAICQANGGNLLMIDDAAENTFITNLQPESTWLALSDQATEGTFVWVNGAPISYENWGTDQPDDWQVTGGEDFVHLRADGTWNDAGSESRMRFIIEMPCPTAPACSAISNNINAFTFVGEFDNSKYFIADNTMDWLTARTLCEQAGGHLVAIGSQAENDFIWNNTTPSSGSIWTGLFNINNTAVFEWTNGESVNYTNWNAGEPNGTHNPVATRMRNDNGRWTDRPYSNQYNVVMEIPCPAGSGSGDAIVSQLEGLSPNSQFPVGTTTVLYQATDDCGNAAYCEFDVIVNPPGSTLQINGCPTDITVTATQGANSAIASWTNPTGSSDCTSGNTTLSQIGGFANGTAFPIGQTTVSYRAVDGCGNEQFCSFFVTVEATPEPPTAITENCLSNMVVITAPGAAFANVNWTLPPATTTCPGSPVDITQIGGLAPNSDFPIGNTVIFYRLEDECGNVASCAFNVTVNSTPATITIDCPANISIDAAPDAEFASAAWTDPTSNSDCYSGSVNLIQIGGLPKGSLFPVGNNIITYKATDGCGQFAVCNFIVTVNATPITSIDPCVNNGGDADGDGVCTDVDCDDTNPLVSAPGDSCDDGNPNTGNDTIQADCSCLGTVIPCAANGGDADGDGICADVDCDDNNPNISTPGDNCDDGNPNTSDDIIQADCSCAGMTTDPCFGFGGDSDGDGVCAVDDCDDTDPNISQQGDTCDDGDPDTENDMIQADCSCAGTPIDLCVNLGGDSDGDGVCDDNDCYPNDANISHPGDVCDDFNSLTENDIIQADCSCEGTLIPPGTCQATWTIDGLQITVNNISAPIAALKILNSNFNPVFSCDDWTTACSDTEVINVPSPGTYFVQIQTFQDWSTPICDIFETLTVNGIDPCLDSGGDSDGDGICAADDCDDNNPNISQPGDPCDDGNTLTENDVIQADCSCAGTTPIDPCENNGGDADGDGVCADVDCDDTNPNISQPSDVCDDNDPTTTGDQIQPDCSCQGTTNTCSANWTINDLTITLDNIAAPIASAKVLDNSFSPIFSCNDWTAVCQNGETITVPAPGTYWIQIQTYLDWSTPLCDILEQITVNGIDPCESNGGDADGDGVCADIDCDDTNPNIGEVGSSCNDGDLLTENDVIQADCSCAGTPIPDCSENVTDGGTIDGDETVCPTDEPAPITNVTLPSVTNNNASVEYIWLSSIDGCPNSLADTIPGAHSPTYAPGLISQTTYFRRCARLSGCLDWFSGESNCIVKTIDESGACEPPNTCEVTYEVIGNDLIINNLIHPITAIQVADENFATVFSCNDWTTACSNPQSVILSPGTYVLSLQTYADWSTQVCNIYESFTVTGNGSRSTILGLDATPNQGMVELSWVNNTGSWNDFFEIEKSSDGNRWESIETTQSLSQNDIPKFYTSADRSPLSGTNFYRVKLTYLDGSVDYSEVRGVNISQTEQFGLFPNPAQETVNVSLEGFEGKDIEIRLTDQLGHVLNSIELQNVSERTQQLELHSLSNGFYQVWVFPKGGRPVGKRLIVGRQY